MQIKARKQNWIEKLRRKRLNSVCMCIVYHIQRKLHEAWEKIIGLIIVIFMEKCAIFTEIRHWRWCCWWWVNRTYFFSSLPRFCVKIYPQIIIVHTQWTVRYVNPTYFFLVRSECVLVFYMVNMYITNMCFIPFYSQYFFSTLLFIFCVIHFSVPFGHTQSE